MVRRAARPLIATVLLVALAVPVLLGGGLFVGHLVRSAFATEAKVRATRTLAFAALRAQLDEETAIRGYASSRQLIFLQPYDLARTTLPATLTRLQGALRALGLPHAAGDAADAARTNRTWLAEIAVPARAGVPDSILTQQAGKSLVDRFRRDLQRVDAALDRADRALDVQTEHAVAQIGVLVLAGIVVIAIVTLGFGVQQSLLTARLEAERRIADTLQDAFLQKTLPELVGVTFSAAYVPASEAAKVGGDWYEGAELPGGRVMFAIGDVAGHGLEAAVSMNRARRAFIAAALLDPDPAAMLRYVNAELSGAEARLVTAACGYVDRDACAIVYGSAGHPPPILVEPGQAPRFLALGGLPLAVEPEPAYETHVLTTVPGALLVLYTDGAVEHSRDVIAGEEELLAAVRDAYDAGAPDPAAAIRDAIFDRAGRVVGDDVAIFTIGFAERALFASAVSGSRGQSFAM